MKLLIVEDEPLFLESLCEIDWGSIGITEKSTATGAYEAITKINENPPDIVISDIQMNNGDGFELAEHLSCILPSVKMIFLTAYEKFEYAQKAIQFKAYAFILKPLNRKELLDTVSCAIAEIKTSRAQNLRTEAILSDFNNCQYFMKKYFMFKLASPDEQFRSMFPLITNSTFFQVITISIFGAEDMPSEIPFSLFVDTLEIFKYKNIDLIPFYDQTVLTYIICYKAIKDADSCLSSTLATADILQQYVQFNCKNPNFTICIGSVANSSDRIPCSEQTAAAALKYRFTLGKNSIIYIGDMERMDASIENFDVLKSELINNIKIGNEIFAEKAICNIFSGMAKSHFSIDLAQRICFELFISISISLAEIGENPHLLFDKTDIWTVLKKYNSLQSLENALKDVTHVTISIICAKFEGKKNDLIEEVKKIIDSDAKDLSLNTVAKQVHVSSCYLSTLFKQKTGVSYKKYVIDTKIKKAKELLCKTDMKIYEIASALGYNNNQHFSNLFLSETGLLPTEYRKKFRDA